MFLGIDDITGLIYESVGSVPDRPVLPIPMVSQARLIKDHRATRPGRLATGHEVGLGL